MVPHGAEVLVSVLAIGGELFDPVLVDVADLLALWGEVEFGVAGGLGVSRTTAHCGC